MRSRLRAPVLVLLFGSAGLAASGCRPETDGHGSDEILATEDVGGAIDAELSTEDDPRGRRRVESDRVLPPGFPADLPVPAESSVIGRGSSAQGKSFVVLATSLPAQALLTSWTSLLEVRGWSVRRSSESELVADKAGTAVAATVTPARSGSELRIVYQVAVRE